MKNTIKLLLVFLLIGCGSRKKSLDEVDNKVAIDTIMKRDTIRIVKTDSTYKNKYKEAIKQMEESNDSVVIVKFKDRIITKKFGNKSKLKSQRKKIDSLINISTIQNLKISELRQGRNEKSNKESHKKSKRSGLNWWRIIAFSSWGIFLFYFLRKKMYI